MPGGRPKLRIKSQVTALITKGVPYTKIAQMLECSPKTVRRIASEVLPGVEEADTKLAQLTAQISKVITIEARAEKYADLAKNAKNEAVSLGALTRIDDLDGIVTEKERMRLKLAENKPHQPMFVLPPGTSVSVTVSSEPEIRNITPGPADDDRGNNLST